MATKFKKALIWSLVNGKYHSSLTKEEQQISNSMPILAVLFPGIVYYSSSGFSQVMHTYGIPALKKLFPELLELPEKEVLKDEIVDIEKPFLKSKKYEWQDDPTWKMKFDELIAV